VTDEEKDYFFQTRPDFFLQKTKRKTNEQKIQKIYFKQKKNSEKLGKRKMNKIQFVKNGEVAMIDFKIPNKTLKKLQSP